MQASGSMRHRLEGHVPSQLTLHSENRYPFDIYNPGSAVFVGILIFFSLFCFFVFLDCHNSTPHEPQLALANCFVELGLAGTDACFEWTYPTTVFPCLSAPQHSTDHPLLAPSTHKSHRLAHTVYVASLNVVPDPQRLSPHISFLSARNLAC
jgi:hypothetical protein